jgi:hypothetical protein
MTKEKNQTNLQQDFSRFLGQRLVAELAVFLGEAFHAGVEILAGKVRVHVQTLLLFGTAIHQIKLAQFEFTLGIARVQILTVIAL